MQSLSQSSLDGAVQNPIQRCVLPCSRSCAQVLRPAGRFPPMIALTNRCTIGSASMMPGGSSTSSVSVLARLADRAIRLMLARTAYAHRRASGYAVASSPRRNFSITVRPVDTSLVASIRANDCLSTRGMARRYSRVSRTAEALLFARADFTTDSVEIDYGTKREGRFRCHRQTGG